MSLFLSLSPGERERENMINRTKGLPRDVLYAHYEITSIYSQRNDRIRV